MIDRTVSINGVGKPAHRMFFGTAIPVMLEGGDANALISTAVDAGFNAIDTARSYGRAEESIVFFASSPVRRRPGGNGGNRPEKRVFRRIRQRKISRG